MSKLVWTPQKAFADYFSTDKREIISRRSVFKPGLEYLVPYGGRGSGKTWTFSDACVVEGSLRPVRVLVTRELQNSIDDSIKSEIEACIHNRGLERFYKIQDKGIYGLNGTEFMFKGLKNNINSIKSIADVEIVLAEESESISDVSWAKLLPSIRPRSGASPIIIVIFNPDDELDATYQRFVVNPPPNCLTKLLNYYHNKYFPEHLERQRLHCKRTMPDKKYRNIWEGEPMGANDKVIIDRDWVRAARFASRLPGFEQVGPTVVGYDPAGQGRDYNAVLVSVGNRVVSADEWLKSKDLRVATRRAMRTAYYSEADVFRYDECGGFGDGITVFIDDILAGKDEELDAFSIEVIPFNAGDSVVNPDKLIEGTEKTNEEEYSNLKAQAHGVSAQLLYNTYRFAVLGEDVDPKDMVSIDIEDDEIFNKLTLELSTPIWIKSRVNSKKQVESKEDMEKRTELPSPNLADSFHMLRAPVERRPKGFIDAYMDKIASQRMA